MNSHTILINSYLFNTMIWAFLILLVTYVANGLIYEIACYSIKICFVWYITLTLKWKKINWSVMKRRNFVILIENVFKSWSLRLDFFSAFITSNEVLKYRDISLSFRNIIKYFLLMNTKSNFLTNSMFHEY